MTMWNGDGRFVGVHELQKGVHMKKKKKKKKCEATERKDGEKPLSADFSSHLLCFIEAESKLQTLLLLLNPLIIFL